MPGRFSCATWVPIAIASCWPVTSTGYRFSTVPLIRRSRHASGHTTAESAHYGERRMSSSTADLVAEQVAAPPEVARAARWPAYIALGIITLLSACTTTLAMRRTSTTFDEIVMIAGGA